MINKKNGLNYEYEIITYINEKKYYKNMNTNIQDFLNFIFGFKLDKFEIKAEKFHENYKPDIVITANGITKYISIKTGKNNSVHQEHFYSFLNFTNSNGATKEMLCALKIFQFNDNTMDGSGNIRRSALDYQIYNQDKIQLINNFFNDEANIKNYIERILFKGEYFNIPIVDYIYYGNIREALWASREEIIKYLMNLKTYSASPHVSKLYYQTLHRNLKHEMRFEFRRYYVQFKWHSLKEDLQHITHKRKKQ